MTVPQAASYLGISAEAVRARVQRGTLPHTKEEGKVYVLLDRHDERHDGDGADRHDDARTTVVTGLLAAKEDLIERQQDQIGFLRAELAARNEELRRKDTIIMTLAQRVPELEAPASSGLRESPESVAEEMEGEEPRPATVGAQEGSERRPGWFRRFFGFE